MAQNSFEVTKQAIAERQPNGICQMLDMVLRPDESGVIKTTLEGGAHVDINVRSGQISVQDNMAQTQVTRTYDVGHPSRSGQITELQLRPLVVHDDGREVRRVAFNLNMFSVPFPDGRSYITIRGGTQQESVTLY